MSDRLRPGASRDFACSAGGRAAVGCLERAGDAGSRRGDRRRAGCAAYALRRDAHLDTCLCTWDTGRPRRPGTSATARVPRQGFHWPGSSDCHPRSWRPGAARHTPAELARRARSRRSPRQHRSPQSAQAIFFPQRPAQESHRDGTPSGDSRLESPSRALFTRSSAASSRSWPKRFLRLPRSSARRRCRDVALLRSESARPP